MIELKYAEYILKIVDTGNISKAAKEISISQPALSRILKSVEKEIGFSIFQRSTLPLKPTLKGLIYINYLKDVLSLEKKMLTTIEQISEHPKKVINIGLVPERGLEIYSQILPILIKQQDNIDFLVQNGYSKNLEQLFLEQKLEICILNSPLQKEINNKIILNRENILLIISKNNSLITKFIVEDNKILNFTNIKIPGIVVLDKQHRMRKISEDIITCNKIQADKIIEVFNQNTAAQLVASSNFISFVAESFLQNSKVKDDIISFKIGTIPYTWDLLLLYSGETEKELADIIVSRYHELKQDI